MFRSDERGIALVMALFMTMIVSALAAGMAYVARTETLSSQSYTTMAHSRYAAESGLAAAANYLLSSSYVTVMPGTPADAIGNYVTSTAPVTRNGQEVVLSTVAGASNYPANAVVTAFETAASGTLTVNNGSVTYGARARLLAMRQITDSMSLVPITLQKWEVTGVGRRTGSGSSEVEVTAIIERQTVPLYRYAAFATDPGCSALTFAGGATTKSYNSNAALTGGGTPALNNTDGDVGTNGNLAISGNPTTIKGTLSTPRTGVGSCTTSNVTAMTVLGNATVSEGLVELPQVVEYPTPQPPSPMPPTTAVAMNAGFTCASFANCSVSGSTVTLTPTSPTVPYVMGDVSVGPKDLVLNEGTYIFNSLKEVGTAKVTANGNVIIKIAGQNDTSPLFLGGGSISNNTFRPAKLQIIYGGTGNLSITGGTETSALVYAPLANVSLNGNGNWYGAIVGGRMTVPGSASIYYDINLSTTAQTAGNPVMSSFTWRTF